MLKNKKAIIFDFDGTLVETMQIFADVASALISRYYNMDRTRAREKYFGTSGFPFHQQLEMIFPDNELNKEVAPIYETQKLEATADVGLDGETSEALNALKRSGRKLIISSNNFQHNIDNFINKNNLHNVFDLALGFREKFGKGKEHFNFAMEKLNLQKNAVVFIGDSLSDYKLAQGEGIAFIGKIGTFGETDFKALCPAMRTIIKISDLLI